MSAEIIQLNGVDVPVIYGDCSFCKTRTPRRELVINETSKHAICFRCITKAMELMGVHK
jgi:hypothetical protein